MRISIDIMRLPYSGVGSSTVENIAYVCGTSETEARFKLKIMQGERWVAVNRTKMVT